MKLKMNFHDFSDIKRRVSEVFQSDDKIIDKYVRKVYLHFSKSISEKIAEERTSSSIM